VFHQENALHRLEDFASTHGPRFYGLPLNEGQITLEQQSPESDAPGIPLRLSLANGTDTATELVPFHAGELLPWRLKSDQE
jgi:dihydroorotase